MKEYIIKYQKNNKIKTIILKQEEYEKSKLPNNIIEIKQKNNLIKKYFLRKTITNKELLNSFYELNLMLNSNLLLDEALDILINNLKKQELKDFFIRLKYSFSNYTDINSSLKDFKIDNTIKALLKITQDNGNIKQNISILYEILKDEYETKKKLKRAFAYPFILLVSFFLALIGIFKIVVPKFEYMLMENQSDITFATKTLFILKDIFEKDMDLIILILVLLSTSVILFYKKSIIFERYFHKILLLKIPILSKIYKYQLIYRFFTIVNSLLNSKYEFYETINKSKSLINNKYFLDRITEIDDLLKSGKSIGYTFEEVKLFDELIVSMIKTAQKTNSLTKVSFEIKTIYKKRFEEKIQAFSLMIEPIFFVLIMGLIIWIVLAVFVPLWSMSDILKV